MNIAVDFDGTVTMNNCYPKIDNIRPYVKEVINKLREKGHKLYLWTCRQNKELEDAIEFLNDNEIYFDGYNRCDYEFGNRKMIAELYIDDRSYPIREIDWLEIYEYITNEKFQEKNK